MKLALYIIGAVLGVFALAVIAFLIYFISSPMPVVKKLRGGMDGPITYPKGSENLKDNIEIKKDLTYLSKYGKNTLDLYLPKDDGKYPLVKKRTEMCTPLLRTV